MKASLCLLVCLLVTVCHGKHHAVSSTLFSTTAADTAATSVSLGELDDIERAILTPTYGTRLSLKVNDDDEDDTANEDIFQPHVVSSPRSLMEHLDADAIKGDDFSLLQMQAFETIDAHDFSEMDANDDGDDWTNTIEQDALADLHAKTEEDELTSLPDNKEGLTDNHDNFRFRERQQVDDSEPLDMTTDFDSFKAMQDLNVAIPEDLPMDTLNLPDSGDLDNSYDHDMDPSLDLDDKVLLGDNKAAASVAKHMKFAEAKQQAAVASTSSVKKVMQQQQQQQQQQPQPQPQQQQQQQRAAPQPVLQQSSSPVKRSDAQKSSSSPMQRNAPSVAGVVYDDVDPVIDGHNHQSDLTNTVQDSNVNNNVVESDPDQVPQQNVVKTSNHMLTFEADSGPVGPKVVYD